jgi:RNA polymerase sigma-70 factor (ECF subfamily)
MSANIIKKFKNKQTLSRLKSRDKEVFTEVYDENVADIHRFVYFKIGSKEEANDLTSIIFLKTWNHIQNNTLEDAKTLRALLYKVARNAIIDYYREQGSRKFISINDEENPIEIASETDTSFEHQERLDQEKSLELIRSKLPLLKEEYREIIIMRFINDLTLEEIADITQKSRGNIRVLTHRALKALKELIEVDETKEPQL